MAGIYQKVPPLDWQTPIVNPQSGIPTPQFMLLWQQMFGNTDDTIENLDDVIAEVIEINDEIGEIRDIDIIAGTGLDGGGPLTGDVTIDLADTAVTPGTYGDSTHVAEITVDQQGRITDVNEVAISGGGGGGGAWTVAASWDFSTDGAIAEVVADVTSASSVLIEMTDVTASVSGRRGVEVSTDGGSTYYSASGNYVFYSSTGTSTASTFIPGHSTNSTAARNALILIDGVNLSTPVKPAFSYTQVVGNAFVATSAPITHVRAANIGGGNMTGGSVRILIR